MAGRVPTKDRAAQRCDHEAPKERAKVLSRERQRRNRRAVRAWILEYLKAHPCVDCGETNPVVLEFDHVRGKKEFNIGKASSKNIGMRRLQEEIAKCDVRCANCHRKKTYIHAGHTHKDS